MKKRYAIWILAVLLMLTLTACGGCKHEWQETSCEVPKTCSLCGETEAEALGHNWVEADCETPKTCSVCGETEGEAAGHNWQEATCANPKSCSICAATGGEPLSHRYGKWTISGEKMTRSCTSCGDSITQAIDREIYFRGNSAGHYDTLHFMLEEAWYSPYDLENDTGIYLKLTEEGEILLDNGGRTFEGTWEFLGYEKEENVDCYLFQGNFGGDSGLPLSYCEKEGESYVVLTLGEFSFVLGQNIEYVEAMTGLWANQTGNTMIYLKLNEDRTFTAELPSQMEGTWHIRQIKEEFGSRYMEILLSAPGMQGRDNIRFKRYFYGDTDDVTQLLNNLEDASLHAYHNRTTYTLKPIEEEAFTQKIVDIEAGQKAIAGTWESWEHTVTDRQTQKSRTGAMVGYSFTFQENGTFQAVLEEEKQGTWVYLDRPNDYTRYILYFDGEKNDKSWHASLYDDGRFYISYYGDTETVNYVFRRPEERVVAETEGDLPGTWYSTVYQEYDVETKRETSSTRKDDFLIFHADGTLTGRIIDQCTGIWEYESTFCDQEIYFDTYKLLINGKEEPFHVNYYPDEGTMNLNYHEDGISYSCIYVKELAEEQQMFIEKGMEKILGEWVSTLVSEMPAQGNEIKDEVTDAYSLTVYADGTFEYHYREEGTGTWLYDGYDESSNQLTYTFNYMEDSPYSYRYSLDKDDVLFGWDNGEGGARLGYYFQRKK